MGQHTQQKLIRDILFLQQVQHNSLMTCLHFFSQGINLVSKFEFAQTFVSIKPDQCSNKSRVMKYLTSSTVTQLIIPHSILSSKKSQDAGCNWSSIFFGGGDPADVCPVQIGTKCDKKQQALGTVNFMWYRGKNDIFIYKLYKSFDSLIKEDDIKIIHLSLLKNKCIYSLLLQYISNTRLCSNIKRCLDNYNTPV